MKVLEGEPRWDTNPKLSISMAFEWWDRKGLTFTCQGERKDAVGDKIVAGSG